MASAAAGFSNYLAILKASYDYTPQSDDEIKIKEDQLLLLVDKVDEDWWKVKIKGETQDEEGPIGLVPAAYVEQAPHTSLVKVLYDYDAAAEGELSVKEDDILRVFETEGDWILAQSDVDDAAGYVPGNYVEAATSGQPAAAPAIVVPDSPPMPPRASGTYEDPAARVQAHKLSADDIKTWSVSELDKKGKKKKGTLGVGNGSLFFASESDKAAVQKWQTSDVTDVYSDKPKQIVVVVGGPNPVTLHFHAGSKDNAEEILEKVKSSKAISTSTTNGASPEPTRTVPPVAEAPPRNVHFAKDSPVIIPPAPPAEEEDEEEEDDGAAQDIAVVLYDFKADGEDELSVQEGEQLLVLERDGDEWWKCRNASGAEGVVPAQYLEAQATGTTSASTPIAAAARPQPVEDDDEDEEEAERLRLAQEEEERAEAERLKREAEAKRKKQEAQRNAKEAAAAAEAERQKRLEKEARDAATAARQQEEQRPNSSSSGSKRPSSSSSKPAAAEPLSRPPPEKTRTWHDRSGQFKVDAAFLGFTNGKLRLHKTNGVVVEVPAEKMSAEDMRFVERSIAKTMAKRQQSVVSDDDTPLSVTAKVNVASGSNGARSRGPVPPKKAPQIDWFDFFLGAGCDLDDCTRYAASFERDKIDETILPDVTDSTMRSLGLKEGDIIRVKKAIEKRKPTDNLNKPSPYIQDQIRRDEELARQLQAGQAPANLFTSGPGGVLKAPRRGRPQPKGSLPLSNVDIKAIDSASDSIQRSASPRSATPLSAQPTSSGAVQAPPRSSSALAPPSSGFDDDAWAPRPSSTKPVVGTPPSQTPRAPSAPPQTAAEPKPAAAPAPTPAAAPAPAPAAPVTTTTSPPSLAKTTESDIFDQLARLSELRKNTPSAQPALQQQQQQQQLAPQQAVVATPPIIQTPQGFQMGMGISNSPAPLGQLQAQVPLPLNAPRGPFAPVPANQGLLQPLIPTQTGFNSFIPTRPPQQQQSVPPLPMMQTNNNMLQPTMNSLSPPPMMLPQQTGMMFPQQTGMPMNGGGGGAFGVQGNPFSGGTPMMATFQNNSPGFGAQQMQPLQPQYTSFNGNAFNGLASPPPIPPVPPMPPAATNNTPANIFASMKSGTFEDDNNQNNSGPRPADAYDALRVNTAPIQMQPTGWGQQPYGMGFQQR